MPIWTQHLHALFFTLAFKEHNLVLESFLLIHSWASKGACGDTMNNNKKDPRSQRASKDKEQHFQTILTLNLFLRYWCPIQGIELARTSWKPRRMKVLSAGIIFVFKFRDTRNPFRVFRQSWFPLRTPSHYSRHRVRPSASREEKNCQNLVPTK